MGFGSGMNCWRWFRDRQATGVRHDLHLALLGELRSADKLDFSRVRMDGASMPSPGGSNTGPNPRDRESSAASAISSRPARACHRSFVPLGPTVMIQWCSRRTAPCNLSKVSTNEFCDLLMQHWRTGKDCVLLVGRSLGQIEKQGGTRDAGVKTARFLDDQRRRCNVP